MKIVWLAAADARGHLMRAHLLRGLLEREGVRVSVITTSEEGRSFLAALGTPAKVLSCHYGVAFDAWQNMERARTDRTILRYLATPSRALADLRRLDEACEGADYVVNDFHPLLLVAEALRGRAPCPVVHVYGENLWRAIEGNFEGRGPAFVDRRFGALTRSLRDRGYARIEHGFGLVSAGESVRRTYRLLPAVAAPRRSASEVRVDLGLAPGARLAAVYLNPHFSDPVLAEAIEGALAARGLAMHAVGEGFARRPGWRPYDPAFADVVAAADVLVSAPGMAAVGHARLLGTPFLALLTDQPEQRGNVRFLEPGSFEAVDLGAPGPVAGRICSGIARLSGAGKARDPDRSAEVIAAVHARWVSVLTGLARGRERGSRATIVNSVNTCNQEVCS